MSVGAASGHPDEQKLRSLIAELSVADKARLVAGAGFWTLTPLPQIGLRELVFSDGPNGVRGSTWDERDTSPLTPVASAVAATWDRDMAYAAGDLFGTEAARRGIDVVLAPTVNLHRSPYGGRHFENFSEDPLLVAEMGAGVVSGIQAHDVAATPKHFVANDSETERMTYDVAVDADTLRDVYLKPFRWIVRRVGPWALMAAYNSVNGRTMTEHSTLVNDVLKAEWNWDGVLVSDWFGARSTDATANGGLDVAMPGVGSPWAEGQLAEAVGQGRVAEEVLDDKVLRVLRLAWRTGALRIESEEPVSQQPAHDTSTRIRDMATRGFVLLRNEHAEQGPVLPLDRSTRRIAVIGENAVIPVVQGGGSSHVSPPYVVTPLDGVRAAAPEAVVSYQRGVRHRRLLDTPARDDVIDPNGEGNGFRLEYLNSEGSLLTEELRGTERLMWMAQQGMPPGTERIRLRGKLRVGLGEHVFGVSGTGAFSVEIAGRVVLDERVARGDSVDDPMGDMLQPPERRFNVVLMDSDYVDDGTVHITVHYTPAHLSGIVGLGLGYRAQQWDDASELAASLEVARDADVAVVVVGTSDEVESEGQDRSYLELPGAQDELVRRVAEVNPRTVVVVNAGSPVLLPWASSVPAVLWTWFGSQEYGNALADVLFGAAEPGGRLPTSLPAELSDVPVALPGVQPTGGKLYYSEGELLGYRAYLWNETSPAFHFGEGHGYTEWDYVSAADEGDTLRVRVRNVGERPGSEVVQVYASGMDSPARLVGFAKIYAESGADAEVSIHLDELYESERGLTVGRSVGDQRLTVR